MAHGRRHRAHRGCARRAARGGRRHRRRRRGFAGGLARRHRTPHEHAPPEAVRLARRAHRRSPPRRHRDPQHVVRLDARPRRRRPRGRPARSPTTSSGTTTSSTPRGRCAGGGASTCPPRSSCTRPGCSARPTPTRGRGSTTRCATSSGCSARSTSLSAGEKLLYGASSVRRWMRTVARSHERDVLRDGWKRGYRDGTRTRPRPNAMALAGLGRASDAVQRVEPS